MPADGPASPQPQSGPDQSNETLPASGASAEEILDVGGARRGRGRRGGGGRRSAYATRELTEGSIRKNLWFLAWPQMVEGILNSLDQTADLFWAGHAGGFKAIGGMGVAQSYTRLIMAVRMGLDTGMQAMIARAVGAGRLDLANHVALQGFTLTILFALGMAVIGILLADELMRMLGVSEDVIAETVLYLRIQFIGASAMGLRTTTGAAL